MDLQSGEYPGVRILLGDQRWLDREALIFDLWNEGGPFDLLVRVDDAHSDEDGQRGGHRVRVNSGANRCRVVLADLEVQRRGRALNLTAIRQVLWFAERSSAARTFYLDHVRLE